MLRLIAKIVFVCLLVACSGLIFMSATSKELVPSSTYIWQIVSLMSVFVLNVYVFSLEKVEKNH